MLLVVAAGSVLLGTLYPLFLDALGLGKISVGPPYFNAVFVPLMAPRAVPDGRRRRWRAGSSSTCATCGARLRLAAALALVGARGPCRC